jgi:hypothetical protein
MNGSSIFARKSRDGNFTTGVQTSWDGHVLCSLLLLKWQFSLSYRGHYLIHAQGHFHRCFRYNILDHVAPESIHIPTINYLLSSQLVRYCIGCLKKGLTPKTQKKAD